MRIPDEQKVCVRGMPTGVTEEEVRDFFGSCGNVIDVYLKDNGVDTFGFVGFEKLSSREEAMGFDGREFKDCKIQVEAKRSQGGVASGRDAYKIFVGGLQPEVTDEEIRTFFDNKVGPVTDYFRKEKGPFAFVGFGSAREQDDALRLDGRLLGPNPIRVELKGGGRGYRPRWRYDTRFSPRRRYDYPRSPPRERLYDNRRSPPRERYYDPHRSPPRRRHEPRSPPRERFASRSPPHRSYDSRERGPRYSPYRREHEEGRAPSYSPKRRRYSRS